MAISVLPIVGRLATEKLYYIPCFFYLIGRSRLFVNSYKTYDHPRRPAGDWLRNIYYVYRLILFIFSKVLEGGGGGCGGMGYKIYPCTWATVGVAT